MPLQAFLLLVAVFALGCQGSRWARDDPDYAAKYPNHTDNVARMTKQAIDARHVKDKWGAYAGVSGRGEPFALGGDVGGFYYPTSYLELRGGLSGLIYENDTPLSAGLLGGARLQTPTRFAPFIGLGAYGGLAPGFDDQDDGLDNDFDGLVDNASEANDDWVLAVVPETGAHFWLTTEWRLTAGLAYLLTTDGGDDFLLGTISLAKLTGPGGPVSQRGLAKAASDGGWKVGDGISVEEMRAVATPPVAVEPYAVPAIAPPEFD